MERNQAYKFCNTLKNYTSNSNCTVEKI